MEGGNGGWFSLAGGSGGWFSVRVYSLSLCLKRPTTRQQEKARAPLATQRKNSLGAQHAPRGGGFGLVHLEVNSNPQHTGALSVPMRLPKLPSHKNNRAEKSFQAFKLSDIDNSRTGLDTSKNQCSAPAVTALKNYWRYHVYNLFRLKNSSNVFAFIIILSLVISLETSYMTSLSYGCIFCLESQKIDGMYQRYNHYF